MPVSSLDTHSHRPTRTNRKSGFTTFELMVSLSMMGLMTLLGLPKFSRTLTQERMRAAVTAISMQVAVARETAVARGCLTTLHLTSGADGRAWITSCKTVGAGVDTVGTVDPVAGRFRVTLGVTTDSVRFMPTGLRADYETTQVSLSIVDSNVTGSVAVNQLGKAIVQ
jgi:Tfp pilus assembly protein FimT